MAMLEVKTVEKPDERRDFPRGHLEVVHLTGLDFAVGTFEPGWRWSESVGPIAGTASCQVHHNGYVVQGRMHVRMDRGGRRGRDRSRRRLRVPARPRRLGGR